MDSLEMSAKTVDEAIELALKQLDAEREEVEVSVVSRGRSGILGIGAEPARVRVTRLSDEGGLAALAMEVVTTLLKLMDVEAVPTIRSAGTGEEDPPVINIRGDDSGLLIGRRGETLRTFQFMVNLLLRHKTKDRVRVILDVEEYLQRRQKSLQQLALRVAGRVASTGHAITLEPMPPAERRMVHVALTDNAQVFTESVGEGADRKVSIIPQRGG